MSNKLGKFLLMVMLGLSLFQWTDQPAAAAPEPDIPSEVLLKNGYRVIFDGVEYHEDGTSTWLYTVEEQPDAQDLVDWVLETPFCAPIIDAGPEPWEIVDPDRNAHLSGIKWGTSAGFQQGQFWVMLDTTGQVGVTTVAAEGSRLAFGKIAGPTCVEEEPPVGPGDHKRPTVEWVEPVKKNKSYDVQKGDSVELVVIAKDNVAVDRVIFMRWDAFNEAYVTIAEDNTPPYQVIISARELNPTWNQILASSFDVEGNQSGWESIWLYKITDEPVFGSDNTRLFLPSVSR